MWLRSESERPDLGDILNGKLHAWLGANPNCLRIVKMEQSLMLLQNEIPNPKRSPERTDGHIDRSIDR